MLFTDEFLNNLSDNPHEAIVQITGKYISEYKNVESLLKNKNTKKLSFLNESLELYSLFIAFNDKHTLDLSLPNIELATDRGIVASVRDWSVIMHNGHKRMGRKQNRTSKIEGYNKIFSASLGTQFIYEFEFDDLKQILKALNEIRYLITKSEVIDEKHKRRLLTRMEKLQSELHEKVSDLDMLWGLIGDAGVVLGKFGKDVKPIVDRIKEVTKITWKAQSKAEGLPEGANPALLGSDD